MRIEVTPSGEACGAIVTSIDLAAPLESSVVSALRDLWLEHHVLSFPGQSMDDDDLERFTLYFGPFGEDPFIAPIPGREHIIAVERAADERSSLFAEAWHTDWSFQVTPPAGTCLLGIIIPPTGGDTLFANQHLALERLPIDLRRRLEGKQAVHSAARAYAPKGLYGEDDAEVGRSMDIRPSDDANTTQLHPLIRAHPETGREGLFGAFGYIIGIDGMDDDDANALLAELYHSQCSPDVQYRHVWAPGTLVMWDNRSVLHRSTGGYDGHARRLHRTTIGAS